MTPIRNSCVARGRAEPGAATAAYTVPDGFVLLLKSVYMSPLQPGAWSMGFYFGQPLPVGFVWGQQLPVNSLQHEHWEGWVALNAGDHIFVGDPLVSANYWISGALLPFSDRLA